jgi:phosphohistidine phosphatase
MLRLMLLRHAKAERSPPGGSDRDRALDQRGRADAPLIGAYMIHHALRPDLVLVSPATRARDTWKLAAATFADAPTTVEEARLYEALPETLLDVIKATGPQASTLLLVSHNPGLQELAVLLIAAGDLEARQRLNEDFPTTGLAVIDFPFDAWRRLHPHAGRLERFIGPRSLTAATD